MTEFEKLLDVVAHLNITAFEMGFEDVHFGLSCTPDSAAIVGPEISGYYDEVDGDRSTLHQVRRRIQIQAMQIAASAMDPLDTLRPSLIERAAALQACEEEDRIREQDA